MGAPNYFRARKCSGDTPHPPEYLSRDLLSTTIAYYNKGCDC